METLKNLKILGKLAMLIPLVTIIDCGTLMKDKKAGSDEREIRVSQTNSNEQKVAIKMENGNELIGNIRYVSDEQIEVTYENGKRYYVPMSKIKNINYNVSK